MTQTARSKPKPRLSDPDLKRGGTCRICRLPLKALEEADRRLGLGESVLSVDRHLRRAFPSEMQGIQTNSLYAHRNRHLQTTQRAIYKANDKDRLIRKKLDAAKAVLKDELDPQSFFGPLEIAQDLKRTETRLHSAADQAYEEKQHASLASLSGVLVRSLELRGKLGGVIQDRQEVSLSVAIGDVVTKLQPLLSAASPDRASAARTLLGLPASAITEPPVSMPMAAEEVDSDGRLTIDNDPPAQPSASSNSYQEPLGTKRR